MRILLPQPISANRYWRQVRLPTRTAVLVSREALAYKREVAGLCMAAGMRPLPGELEMWLTLHPRMKTDGQPSKTRMDLDNCIKVALDACQGSMYANDRQVVRLHAEIGEALADGGLTVRVEAMR